MVSLDGKTVRGSRDGFHGRSPIHMVSAWASDNQLVLGQLKVDDRENEITAIPELLDLLDIRGSIITIDAMGAQAAIAEKIVDGGADYILAVKGNHRDLLDQIKGRFDRQRPCDSDLQLDKGHGRLETRKCDVIGRLDPLTAVSGGRQSVRWSGSPPPGRAIKGKPRRPGIISAVWMREPPT